MAEHKPLYRGGPDDARRNNELLLYRESNRQNRCAEAIDAAIRKHWDGARLDPDTADGIIADFGHDRVRWVLAATMQKSDWDKRYTAANRAWLKNVWIPPEVDTARFIPSAHPEKLNGFADQARRAYGQLNLFDARHCTSVNEFQNVAGHVLVVNPDILKDEYKTPESQCFLAEHGFGCNPTASGRKIYGRHLIDGEQAQYYRQDFLGVLKPEFLPEWAVEKMAEPEPELPHIRVFQVNRDRDTEHRCFEPLKENQQVDPSIYDVVYDGPVPSAEPEDVFAQFNLAPPPLHRGWSMSVSDVVEVAGKHLFVDSFGFQEIEFDASQTQKPDDLLRVVMLEPSLPAYEAEIGPDLQSMQRAVGGHIEVSYPLEGDVVVVCNEEARIIGMAENRQIGVLTYAGPVFIAGDTGEGSFCSLTDEQAAAFCQEFSQPEDIAPGGLEMKLHGP
jgi:hypothetical protein